MKRNARPSLFDTMAGFDDPLEMLLACHRRIEHHLQVLERLQLHLAERGVDAEASGAAQSVLRYFTSAAEAHNEDEEKDLFPLLEERIPAGADTARFHALRERLEAEHSRVHGLWARLRKPLEGIAEGLMRTLPGSDVNEYIDAYRKHIAEEEDVLGPLFVKWLDEADRGALGRSMRERRSQA
jgi:hemerythrin-like domain-containing protein